MPSPDKFAPMAPEKRAAMLDAIRAGEAHRSISQRLGMSEPTVRKYAQRIAAEAAGPEAVERASAPRASAAPRPAHKKAGTAQGAKSKPEPKAKPATGAGPLTEKEGKRIVRGLFGAVSLFLGSGWALEPSEVDELGPSLAEASDVLPSAARMAIRKYWSPINFALQLGAVTQNRVVEAQRQAEGRPTQNPAYTPPPPPGPPPPPNPTIVTPPEQVVGRMRERHGGGNGLI